MRIKFLLIILLFIVSNTYSQENKKVLFTINGVPFYTQEFLNVYHKNLKLIGDSETDINGYLDLFVDYKLKVKEGKSKGLDTLPKYKNELKQYKSNLVLPYLKDKEITRKLIEEAYARLKKEVNVSHILIFLKPNASESDTLLAYNSLIEARNLIIGGNGFAEIAKKYSNDPTVEQNGGDIGYFTALQMVYPFENIAFTTKVNEVSLPFRTKFGYHILKVNAKRDSKGEVEVAHIMLKNDRTAKKRVDSIYKMLLVGNVKFSDLAKKNSDDSASAIKGGKLQKFGTGQVNEDFANVAFSLKVENDISKPFKTQVGWHIIKLIKKYPIKSFDELKGELTYKVERDVRSKLSSKSILDKLFKQYNVTVNTQALQQFNEDSWKRNPEKFQQQLFSIEKKDIFQKDFIEYLKKGKNIPLKDAFTDFKGREVLAYFKEKIALSNEEFAGVFKEFKEGLLIFNLLEKEIWEKAKVSDDLLNYFNLNKKRKYKEKQLENIKGVVISDYQIYLEKRFMNQLHKKYEVKINNTEKKRIKKLNL